MTTPPPAAQAAPAPLVSQSDQQQNAAPSDQAKAVLKQFQDIHSRIQDLASQFPEFAKSARAALQDLNQGMVDIVSNLQGSTEVAAPALGS